jgi:hypothetical protein
MLLGRRRRVIVAPLVPALSLFSSLPSAAQERATTTATPAASGAAGADAAADRFLLVARSETYVEIFQRALLPGPNGAIVTTDSAVPINEYLSVNARDVDAPWDDDSLDLEFQAWGRLWPTSSSYERPFDGDVQTASIRYDSGPVFTRLGRQHVAGGAARFARFDGVTVGARETAGFFVEGYGGYGVLPRWNGQPGYHHLGSAEGELLKDTGPPEERASNWLAGGRVGYTMSRLSGSVSFHEQHETAGVAQRHLGLDFGARPFDEASLGASGIFELDSLRFANLRVFLDTTPVSELDLGVEFVRAEPALMLSRQSVLSVFTTDGYEEAGGNFTLRALQWLRVEGNGFVQDYAGTGPGARGELATRLAAGRLFPTMVRLAYARVIAPDNGYHSVRVSFGKTLSERVASTLEAYGFFYDEEIYGYRTSSVYAGTVTYRVSDPFELLWGGSLASSPYAALDAQTLIRATYEFDAPPRARRR